MESNLELKANLQNRIENFWQGHADNFNTYIVEELNSFKKGAWAKLISANMPAGKSLKVLDVGTGPGFFAMLLAEMGHKVTAVDFTDNMLAIAQRNIAKAGVKVTFHKMDSHHMMFADNYFDFVVCRNLTWLLREPLTAYREWQRVLKPGGRLLIFDANWHMYLFDTEMAGKFAEDRELAKQMGIEDPYNHPNIEEGNKIARELFLSNRWRPQWDAETLLDIGFNKLVIETDITEQVYDENEKVLYRSSPMFMIAADKK